MLKPTQPMLPLWVSEGYGHSYLRCSNPSDKEPGGSWFYSDREGRLEHGFWAHFRVCEFQGWCCMHPVMVILVFSSTDIGSAFPVHWPRSTGNSDTLFTDVWSETLTYPTDVVFFLYICIVFKGCCWRRGQWGQKITFHRCSWATGHSVWHLWFECVLQSSQTKVPIWYFSISYMNSQCLGSLILSMVLVWLSFTKLHVGTLRSFQMSFWAFVCFPHCVSNLLCIRTQLKTAHAISLDKPSSSVYWPVMSPHHVLQCTPGYL